MKHSYLYSPWRMKYILAKKRKECIFCIKPENDKEHLVVYRSSHCFVILNLFPYNNGHIMVVPNKHVSQLSDLDKDELNNLFEIVQKSESVLNKVYKPEGLNVGINIGKAAGAGIDAHLHVHLVPRWPGDTNFMTTIAGKRTIPDLFENTFDSLKETFQS